MLNTLTDQEQEKLVALLNEAENRGLQLDREIDIGRSLKWPTDSRGYFSKRDGTLYNPQENQEDFVFSNALFSALWGSRGCAKTCSGSQKALRKIMLGESGIIASPDFEHLKISTWPEFREWIPWSLVVPSHRYRSEPKWEPQRPFKLAFMNGATIVFKGIKDADSARGPNINWFWFDEAQRTDDDMAWKIAIASVRIGKNPQSWATFTANGHEHWTTKFFIKEDIPQDAIEILRELDDEVGGDRPMIDAYHGTLKGNKENLSPVFVANVMAAYSEGWLRDQEVHGKIVKKEGALGNPAWFDGKIIPTLPEDVSIFGRVRYWDLAATEKKVGIDPDETVGSKVSWDKESSYFYVEDQKAGYWEWADIKKKILETAIMDGPYVKIFVEQEPGAGGKNQVAELKSYLEDKLPGHPRLEGHLPREVGDKVMRANTWFSEASRGLFFMLQGPWNDKFLEQLGCFNYCRHDDRIDSVSGARHTVAPIRTWKDIDFLSV